MKIPHGKIPGRHVWWIMLAWPWWGAAAAELTWTGGVAGVWQNGAAGWLNGGSPANWNNATPDAALFGGLAPGTVSVDAGGVTVGNLTVTQGTYTVGGAGTLTLSSSTIVIGNALTATVSAALGGSSGFTKSGPGELFLSGANKNFTGASTISGGVVRIAATGPGSLGSTATNGVNLAGGAVHALFSANVNVSNAFVVGDAGGELRNLGNDSQRWQMIANRISGSGPLTLSFGASNSRFTMASSQNGFTGRWIVDSGGNANRFADVSGSSAFGGATGDVAIVLQNNGTLLVRNGVTLGSSTQGLYVGSGESKITAAGGATITIAGKLSGPATNAVQFYGDNATSVTILSNTNNNWAGTTTVNGGAAFHTLRLGAAGVLPDAGGLLALTAAARLDLNGFSETVGGLTGAGRVDNAAAASTVTLTVGGNSISTNFTGSMTNSGAGATLSIVKVGSGTWTLSSTNLFYGGSMTVSGGVLQLTSATNGALGATMTNLLQVSGGSVHGAFSNNAFFTHALDIGPGGAEFRNLGDDNQRWLMFTPVGGLTGSGVVTMSFGSSLTRFILTNNQASFTGKWIIDSGGSNDRLIDIYHGGAFGAGTGDDYITLQNAGSLLLRYGITLGSPANGITLGSGNSQIGLAGTATGTIAGKLTGAAGNSLRFRLENTDSLLIISNTANAWLGATTVANTGTLRFGASGVVPDSGGTWSVDPGIVLDLFGNRETIGGLSGSGGIDNRSPSTAAMIGIGANNASTTWAGSLSNSASGATLGLTKVGSGTLTLSGSAHAHSGSTIVSSGVLLVTGTLPANGLAEVAAGTLSCGTSIGHLRVRGGRISPNHTSVGSLSVASMVFTGGTYRFDISNAAGSPGAQWDLITVGGGSGHVTNDTATASPVKIELAYSSSSLPGFTGLAPLSWRMVDAGTQVGFATNKFTVETSLFQPPQKTYGAFSVRSDSGDLYLDFNPYSNQVDLAVWISASTNYATATDTVAYSITVSNLSAEIAGLYNVTSTITGNFNWTGGSAGAVTSGTQVSWSLAGLAPGASTTLVVNAQPVFSGSTQEIVNAVSATVNPVFGDSNNGNNSASTNVTSVGIPMLSDIALAILIGVVAYAWYRRQRSLEGVEA